MSQIEKKDERYYLFDLDKHAILSSCVTSPDRPMPPQITYITWKQDFRSKDGFDNVPDALMRLALVREYWNTVIQETEASLNPTTNSYIPPRKAREL